MSYWDWGVGVLRLLHIAEKPLSRMSQKAVKGKDCQSG